MSRMTSLERELTHLCFDAERAAGQAYRNGDMETYNRLRGMYEAFKDAAQKVEKYFDNMENH